MAHDVKKNTLYWGSYDLRPRAATEHFLVSGASGSGKTLLLNMLMLSVLKGPNAATRRALIYDPKQEVLPLLYGMGLGDRVRILHPLDKRSCWWDMARDINSPVGARQLATILIPEDDSSSQGDAFFSNAVRDLLTGVLLVFIRCVKKENTWTFRDVVLAMLYEPYLKYILSIDVTRDGKPFLIGTRLKESYLEGDARTVSNIRASINAKLSIYEPIAAAWSHANSSISLNDWKKDTCNDILVLGNDEAARSAIDPINAALFKRLVEILLSRRELTTKEKAENENTSWIFLDEVREAGYLDGLSRLLTKGRSKGAAVVLGFQDIDGLRDVYGAEVANELTGQCNCLALLKMNNPTTAQWAVELFGKMFLAKGSSSVTYEPSGPHHQTGTSMDAETILQTWNFIYLPKTGPENGLSGYIRHPFMQEGDDFRQDLDWNSDVLERQPEKSEAIGHEAFQERDAPDQYLAEWDALDWKRLGLPGNPPSYKKQSETPEPEKDKVEKDKAGSEEETEEAEKAASEKAKAQAESARAAATVRPKPGLRNSRF